MWKPKDPANTTKNGLNNKFLPTRIYLIKTAELVPPIGRQFGPIKTVGSEIFGFKRNKKQSSYHAGFYPSQKEADRK